MLCLQVLAEFFGSLITALGFDKRCVLEDSLLSRRLISNRIMVLILKPTVIVLVHVHIVMAMSNQHQFVNGSLRSVTSRFMIVCKIMGTYTFKKVKYNAFLKVCSSA